MFWCSIILIFIIIWIIFKKVDHQEQRYCYNSNIPLKVRLVNIFGYVVRLLFNIHVFLSPNFNRLKQKAIKMTKMETGILLEDFGDENEMKVFNPLRPAPRSERVINSFQSYL